MDFLLSSLGALDLSIYPYCALVVLVASFVRGFSGFAGPMIMAPAFSLVLPPVEVIPIVLLLEMIAAALLVPKIWRIADWRSLRWIMPAALIGAPFGVLPGNRRFPAVGEAFIKRAVLAPVLAAHG